MLSLLLACTGEPPEDPAVTDNRLYTQAITEADPQQALVLCRQITEVSMHGECTMFAAKQVAQAKGNAVAICDELDDVGWQQVCLFEIVDASGMSGEEAVSACARTGSFQERCLAHALQREEMGISRNFPPGKEAEMMAHIRERVTLYGLDGLTEEAIDEKMAARIITERVLRAGMPRGSVPMSLSLCGTATEAVCVEAYRIYVTKVGGPGRVPKDCSVPMNVERVRAVGLPTWVEEFQPLADQAWRHLCKRANTTQHHPPDHRK